MLTNGSCGRDSRYGSVRRFYFLFLDKIFRIFYERGSSYGYQTIGKYNYESITPIINDDYLVCLWNRRYRECELLL